MVGLDVWVRRGRWQPDTVGRGCHRRCGQTSLERAITTTSGVFVTFASAILGMEGRMVRVVPSFPYSSSPVRNAITIATWTEGAPSFVQMS